MVLSLSYGFNDTFFNKIPFPGKSIQIEIEVNVVPTSHKKFKLHFGFAFDAAISSPPTAALDAQKEVWYGLACLVAGQGMWHASLDQGPIQCLAVAIRRKALHILWR